MVWWWGGWVAGGGIGRHSPATALNPRPRQVLKIAPSDMSDNDLRLFTRCLDDDGGGISIVELGMFVEEGVGIFGRDRPLTAEEEENLKPKRGASKSTSGWAEPSALDQPPAPEAAKPTANKPAKLKGRKIKKITDPETSGPRIAREDLDADGESQGGVQGRQIADRHFPTHQPRRHGSGLRRAWRLWWQFRRRRPTQSLSRAQVSSGLAVCNGSSSLRDSVTPPTQVECSPGGPTPAAPLAIHTPSHDHSCRGPSFCPSGESGEVAAGGDSHPHPPSPNTQPCSGRGNLWQRAHIAPHRSRTCPR